MLDFIAQLKLPLEIEVRVQAAYERLGERVFKVLLLIQHEKLNMIFTHPNPVERKRAKVILKAVAIELGFFVNANETGSPEVAAINLISQIPITNELWSLD